MAPSPLSTPGEGEANRADVLLAGGGLANALIALRLKAVRPALRVVLFDARAPEAEDAHTWSFFETDVEPAVAAWLLPLAEHRWRGYDVRFPTHERTLRGAYASLTGRGLQRVTQAALGPDYRLGEPVASLDADGLTTAAGVRWSAPLVIDGRGARRSEAFRLAWQKFAGAELRLQAPHGLERPVIMDASVEQIDGYRFVYLLPFAPDRLLVEDTYYSAGPELDEEALSGRIQAYVADKGWRVAEVVRRERGVLPITLGGDLERYLKEAPADVPAVGMRAPLFHPVTGYSLPEAAALAALIAAAPDLHSAAIAALTLAHVRRRWRETAFLRTLNRMLFLAADPELRYRVLQRFYRLPQPLVERFYAGRPTLGDRARILAGVPPVPVGRALRALPETASARIRAA